MTDRQADPPARRVARVRMYRQGLGDCFLLTFEGGPRPLHMLVDCGVLLGTPDAETRMTEVAEDVRRATGGRLDILVATHEHWDHLSGFLQASPVFEQMTIAELWLAWTEDPEDAMANALRRQRERALAALTRARASLAAAGAPEAERVEALLGFFGDLALGGRLSTRSALERVQALAQRVRYFSPGDGPEPLPGGGGARAFVLGPPRDERLLKKDRPSKRGKEVYELARLEGQLDDLEAAFARFGAAATDRAQAGSGNPFADRIGLALAEAERHPFFRRHYFADAAWRRIDRDWLAAASELALKLDNDTNNTSLVLALELGAGGPVLLLPGDAQVGNWLSWDLVEWPPDGSTSPVTAERLLARTVLYKVAHHASHNATLRELGLERMASRELVALVPVDETMARRRRWKMPFAPLATRLHEKTRGRVVRADRSRAELLEGLRQQAAALSSAQEREQQQREISAFEERLSCDPEDRLWIEYRIPF